MFSKMFRGFAGKCLFAGMLVFLPVSALAFEPAKVSEAYFQALKAEEPMPVVDIAAEDKTEANAYQVQGLLVEKILADRNDSVAGYKGGLTTAAQIQRFGAQAPVSAPLFKSGLIEAFDDPATRVEITSFGGIMLETEFGFKTAAPVTAPVKDVEELKSLIASVHPAIEVPQVYFADMSRINFFDLTGAAVGSRIFIIGPARPKDADFDAMKVSLTRDGVVLSEGTGSEALEGQWSALLWLVNNVLAQGGKIEAGQYFITGALGKMVPAEPGEYKAEYPFGTVEFTVKAR